MMWKPHMIAKGHWTVRLDVDPRKQEPTYSEDLDGAPIRFWSMESAQLKADALNCVFHRASNP